MSRVQEVTEELRARILGGDVAPGEPLGEVDVAERYGVARPTAKAAIENLVVQRLLVRTAHRTARVVRLSADEAFDIYRSREVLEAAAVRHLAADRLVPADAVAANTEIARLVDASPREIVEPDMRFHTALIAELGSTRVRAMYDSLVSEVVLCMSQIQGAALLSTGVIVQEHARLLELIAEGDAEGAADLLSQHVGRARDRLVVRLREARGA